MKLKIACFTYVVSSCSVSMAAKLLHYSGIKGCHHNHVCFSFGVEDHAFSLVIFFKSAIAPRHGNVITSVNKSFLCIVID